MTTWSGRQYPICPTSFNTFEVSDNELYGGLLLSNVVYAHPLIRIRQTFETMLKFLIQFQRNFSCETTLRNYVKGVLYDVINEQARHLLSLVV